MLVIIGEVPLPPSANNLFVNHSRTRGRFPSAEYVGWQRHAGHLLMRQFRKQCGATIVTKKDRWKAAYLIILPKNRMWKSDLDNRLKPMNDLVSKVIGLDDRYLMDIVASKAQYEDDEPVIKYEIIILGKAQK